MSSVAPMDRWRSWSGATASFALLTIGLGVVLLGSLVFRDELPVPPTPAPPAVLIDVVGASIGPEVSDNGTFWTIDSSPAAVRLSNTTGSPRSVELRARFVDGPCGNGAVIEHAVGDTTRTARLERFGSVDVSLGTIDLGALRTVTVSLTALHAPCAPIGGDPRSISFQIYDLRADES